ncbi:MAG TPA: hypothetical protein VM890_10855, partial [Longimicrobium sp.]|nr:hypothetical protein [Longimicrobium sp.]
IVEKYVDAIGGRAAAERYASRHVTAEMTMPATGTTVEMEIWTARPQRVRMVSRSLTNGMTIASGYDGATAWAIAGDRPQLLDRATFEEALGNARFDTNVDLAKTYPTMETLGERTVDGHACWNVRMVSADSTEVHNCFDKESGLLVGTVVPKQGGGVLADVVLGGYRDFDGLRMPTHMTTTVNGQRMVTTLKSVSHAPIPDSVFALPPPVRALVH